MTAISGAQWGENYILLQSTTTIATTIATTTAETTTSTTTSSIETTTTPAAMPTTIPATTTVILPADYCHTCFDPDYVSTYLNEKDNWRICRQNFENDDPNYRLGKIHGLGSTAFLTKNGNESCFMSHTLSYMNLGVHKIGNYGKFWKFP